MVTGRRRPGPPAPATLPLETVNHRLQRNAQRRPGPAPRRHLPHDREQPGRRRRSTNAEARPGDTRSSAAPRSPASAALNEGRKPAPRRHFDDPPVLAQLLARSTKAGTRAPATLGGRPDSGHGPGTLNEGRDPRPGDTWFRYVPPIDTGTLNEGRDPRPGDTVRLAHTAGGTPHAQRRPGPAPRRHALADVLVVAAVRRSTKAGTRAPETRASVPPQIKQPPSLNEGRDPRPGDTSSESSTSGSGSPAQRRPGPAPRRHPAQADHAGEPGQRSTKAGTRAPETRSSPFGASPWRRAQRRPGPAPRRHLPRVPHRLGHEDRSTKAGTRAPATPWWARPAGPGRRCAQRRPGPAPRRHSSTSTGIAWRRSRSTKAGTRAPETLRTTAPRPLPYESLNEGRDPRPGDTPDHRSPAASLRVAQRRPGPAPRRHPCHARASVRLAGRSTKAGTRAPETLQLPRRHRPARHRSTKTGTRAPATPSDWKLRGAPRDRSTKAGTRAPATPRVAVGDDARPARSTKAGTRAPATHETPRRCQRKANTAQRRPGPAPRRHPCPRPGDTSRRGRDQSWSPLRTLNEGRDPRPGDTTSANTPSPALIVAQRRPGPAPRRHPIR